MTAPHFRRIPRAEFAAMYLNPDIPVPEIAARFGLAVRNVPKRARSYGLPVRSLASKRPHITDAVKFKDLWLAGIDASEIAAHFGVHYRTIANTADRLGLPKRRRGQRAKQTLAEYLLRTAMAISAQEEQAALLDAEMVDDAQGMRRRAA